MSELLFGRTLHWASCDADLAVTAALRTMLDESHLSGSAPATAEPADSATVAATRIVLTLASDFADVVALAKQQQLSFVLLVCEPKTDLLVLSETLTLLRILPSPPLRLCYLSPMRAAQAAILVEAGAQIVVSRIPSLQAALPRMLSCVSLSLQGFHPITSGLLERLPWGPTTEALR